MASLNRCEFIGNLGTDPETRYTAGGDPVASIRIACTETWKDKETGEKKESTEWVSITFFKGLAEVVGKYLKKGSRVYVAGRFKTRKWQDKEGNDRYTSFIQADEMLMLDRAEGSSRQQAEDSGYTPAPQRNAQGAPPSKSRFDDMGDEIPFAPIGRGISGHAL